MTLGEFRKTIYEGLQELGVELTGTQLSFLSKKIKEYTKFHNETILKEIHLLTRTKTTTKKKTVNTKKEHKPKGMFDMPNFN